MRIIAGKFRGRSISAPKGLLTRPTTDRVRENLFNALESRLSFEGLRVIDLFSGSGALGLEALSRGAGHCLFVDEAAKAVSAIGRNIGTLQLEAATGVLRRNVVKLGRAASGDRFDLAFADPPYGSNLGEKTAAVLHKGGWLQPNAFLVLEEVFSDFPQDLIGFECLKVLKYGNTGVGIFEYRGSDSI